MLFFDNPKRKRGSRKRGRKRTQKRVRVVRRAARSNSKGESMARKRSRKRRVSRRRGGARKSVGVQVRRRGLIVFQGNPRRRGGRRRYRRNPSIGAGGIVATIKQGVKDGAVILVSQIATKKVIDLGSKFVPVSGIAGAAITGLGGPVVIALIAKKVIPSQARLITAAAFAEGVRRILAATPVGGLLADVVNAGDQSEEYSAWPAPQIPANMGAYPGAGLNDYDYAE